MAMRSPGLAAGTREAPSHTGCARTASAACLEACLVGQRFDRQQKEQRTRFGRQCDGDPRARSTPAASNAFGMSGLSQWVDRHRPYCRCRNGAAELAHAAGSWRAKATSRAACWSGKATTRYSLLCRSPDGGDGVVNVPAPDS